MRTNLDQVPVKSMEFILPSGGLPYVGKTEVPFQTAVVKPYTFDTESILIGNLTGHEKMRQITSKVVDLPPGLTVDDLLISDQFVILAIARALTYGESYKFKAICPKCAYNESITVAIPDQLPVKKWLPETVLPFETVLPVSKDRVAIKYLTVREDGLIDAFERKASKESKDFDDSGASYTRRMAHHLVSVNTDKPQSIDEAEKYIRRLFGEDMAAYKELIQDNTCGILYEWKVCCDKCKHDYGVTFPIASDFFRRGK